MLAETKPEATVVGKERRRGRGEGKGDKKARVKGESEWSTG